MFVAYLESLKYTGHFYPLAFFRIYFGYVLFAEGFSRAYGNYVQQPIIAARINEWLPGSVAPDWYKNILENFVVTNWQLFAYAVSYSLFAIGILLMIGFLVRPICILGFFLSANFFVSNTPEQYALYELHLLLFTLLFWLGAGRCLGLDYFFFKRKRGFWW